jgi:hypothetical protein
MDRVWEGRKNLSGWQIRPGVPEREKMKIGRPGQTIFEPGQVLDFRFADDSSGTRPRNTQLADLIPAESDSPAECRTSSV